MIALGETPVVLFIYMGVTLVFILYYFYRKNQLSKQGLEMGVTHNILSEEEDLSSLL